MYKPASNDEKISLERDVAQWLEHGALSMSLSAVGFRISFGAGFSEKYHVSPLLILKHWFDVVSLGKELYPQMLHLTLVKMSMTEMAMCMISQIHQNGCTTVCSQCRMNRSSDQGVKR